MTKEQEVHDNDSIVPKIGEVAWNGERGKVIGLERGGSCVKKQMEELKEKDCAGKDEVDIKA